MKKLRKIWLELEILAVKAIMLVMVKLMRKKREPYSKEKIQKIMVVNTTAIGDTLMCTTGVRAVRRAFPKAILADLVHIKRKELLEGNPYIDELIIYVGKWKKFFKLLAVLRAHKFDLVIVLHANDPDIIPLAYLGGAKYIAGFEESRFADLLDIKVAHEKEGHNFVERRFALLGELGVENIGDYKKDIFVSDEQLKVSFEFLRSHDVKSDDLLIAFHPGASVTTRRWPLDKYVALGKELTKRYKAKIIIIGGKDIVWMAEYISERLEIKPVIATGLFDLKTSAALLKNIDILVTADSGPAHLASATETPMVVMFGPVAKEVALPSFSKEKCRFVEKDIPCKRPCKLKECVDKGHMCMELIGIEDILKQIEVLLKIREKKN